MIRPGGSQTNGKNERRKIMEGTRRLKGWQMGVMVALLTTLLSTMFMPAFHFSGEVVGDMYSYLVKSIKDKAGFFSGVLDEYIDDELSKEKIEDIDDEIKDIKDEDGIDISSVSPLRIMTNSYLSLITPKDAKDDDIDEIKNGDYYDKLSKGYNSVRVPLIIIYVLAVVVLILVIAAFVAGWPKVVPLIITTVYGVLTAIYFGYLRFAMLRNLGKKYFELIEDAINDFEFEGLGKITISDTLGKLLTYLYSVAFLIAFIAAILLLVICIVSFFVGNSETVLDYDREYDYDGGLYGANMDGGAYDSEFGATEAFNNNINPFGDTGSGGGTGQMAGGDVFGIGNMGSGAESIPVTNAAADIFDQPEPQTPQYNNQQRAPQQSVQQSAMQTGRVGTVRCTKGAAFGQGFQLPEDK